MKTIMSTPTEHPQTFTFVASTSGPDRGGDIIDQAGWQLDNYRRNPVVLLSHNWRIPPVGKAERVWLEANRLMATVRFAPTPTGQELALLAADGYLSAVSVGLIPLKWDFIHNEKGLPTGMHIHQAELLEISTVPVPQNAEALKKGMALLHYTYPVDPNLYHYQAGLETATAPLRAALRQLREDFGG